MMTRLIDQFHKPVECRKACGETALIMNELKALATAIERDEPPEHIKARFEKQQHVSSPHSHGMKATGGHQHHHQHLPPRETCPSGEPLPVGCECNKRNGLQDECRRLCCRGKLRTDPTNVC